MAKTCYMCEVADAGEVPFDPDEHDVCTGCTEKLWKLAECGIAWSRPEGTAEVILRATAGEVVPRVPGITFYTLAAHAGE